MFSVARGGRGMVPTGFYNLLEMMVLPYVTVSIISSLGALRRRELDDGEERVAGSSGQLAVLEGAHTDGANGAQLRRRAVAWQVGIAAAEAAVAAATLKPELRATMERARAVMARPTLERSMQAAAVAVLIRVLVQVVQQQTVAVQAVRLVTTA